MEIKERMMQYLDTKGISPTKAEQVLRWGKGALIKAKSVSADKIGEFLLLFSDLSAEWLLRGEGSMLKSGTDKSSSSNDSIVIDDLKAEINQLKGENRILREQAGLGERKESDSRSA